MRYTGTSIIDDWKKAFLPDPPKAAKPDAKTAVKPAVRIQVKRARKAQVKKVETQPDGKSLVFIRTRPAGQQFRLKETPKEFERIVFVLKACSKDHKQNYLTVLHVEQTKTGSRLIASDGRRLHYAEIEAKIKTGDYKPVVIKDCVSLGEPVTGIMFPNWIRAVPENTRKCGVIDLADTGMGKDRNQTQKLSWAFNSFVHQTGELINLRDLEDLMKKRWILHRQSEKHRAVVLREEGAERAVFAVIVPLPAAELNAKAA
jgi:hypothetical protein